ncbi:hypothetical protein Hanom_Chr11g01022331 [Helianthus anomalus]
MLIFVKPISDEHVLTSIENPTFVCVEKLTTQSPFAFFCMCPKSDNFPSICFFFFFL